ncbi:hypothetical protein [Thermodesulfatator atlanticus]|uniref:hypothetical protein n=1 Tax=Thermodesulfatator atlanticus TaxID=501497 RepID=UPI000417DF38|nr:hypothetical protein [Thermodesulfatator atlanticus]
MKRLLLFTMFVLVLAIPAHAELKKYGSLYGSFMNFNNSSVKDNGWSVLGYLSLYENYQHKFEIGLAQTYIDYKPRANIDNLNQTDFTFLYTNTDNILKNHIFKFGFHYILSDDDITDKGKVFYFDGTYYKAYNWNCGLEFAYSRYHDQINLDVIQLKPHFGYYFALAGYRIYSNTSFYYIHTDEKVSSQKNFYSLEQLLSTFIGNYEFSVSAWIGEQIYAVKNSNFVVYNLSDKYKGGFSAEIGYKINPSLKISGQLTQEWLEHAGYNDDASQTIVTLSIGGSF